MNTLHNRREFFADVDRGMVVTTVGYSLASELGLATVFAADAPDALNFGELEPLVCLMQETAANQLLPKLTDKLKTGTPLKRLVAAAALANARTFGGEDYVGFHTMMALSPSLHQSHSGKGRAQGGSAASRGARQVVGRKIGRRIVAGRDSAQGRRRCGADPGRAGATFSR